MKCKTDDTNIKSHEFEEDSFASQACLKWEEELLVSTFFKFSRDGNMWSWGKGRPQKSQSEKGVFP